jgi:hypothetical protein
MIAIRKEIDEVAAGTWPVEDNPLRGAPHTAASLLGEWAHPYTREQAAYPAVTAAGGLPGRASTGRRSRGRRRLRRPQPGLLLPVT